MGKAAVACKDPRGKNCLMYKDGLCMGISVTDGCSFFKDRRSMTEDEIDDYEAEAWKIEYFSAPQETINRWMEMGERILMNYEIDHGYLGGKR